MRYLVLAVLAATLLCLCGTAQAAPAWYKISFSGADMFNYTATVDELYNQDAPRRVRHYPAGEGWDWVKWSDEDWDADGTNDFAEWAADNLAGFGWSYFNFYGATISPTYWDQPYHAVPDSGNGQYGTDSWRNLMVNGSLVASGNGTQPYWTGGFVRANQSYNPTNYAFPVWRTPVGTQLTIADLATRFSVEVLIENPESAFEPDGKLRVWFGGFNVPQGSEDECLEVSGIMLIPINQLSLDPTTESIYIKPGEQILVNMNVTNLQQKVNACQAMLGYSSTYFANPTGGCVQVPGSGPWDLVIWDSWRDSAGAPSEIDTAIGVDAQGAVGTDADATICKITLTSRTGVEGVTQMVFRADDPDDDTKQTFLSDMTANQVWPAKVDSTNIYIDGTEPVVNSFSADPLCTKTTTTLTFDVEDADSPGKSGVDYVDVYVDDVLVAHNVGSGYALGMSGYATGCYDVKIRVVDKAGNETDSGEVEVCVDKTAPTISNIRAEQPLGTSVLCGEGTAVQGVVDIFVDVVDPGCADLVVPPTVTVDGVGTATHVGPPSGDTYHYQVTVLSTTANGSHTITVDAADTLGNSSSDNSKAICVDKNQITGVIELEGFVGTQRVVTFVATGTTPKTWTFNVTGFSGGKASYKLTNVPAGTTGLSAKTAWSLREKLAVALDLNGQVTDADFVGDATPGWKDADDHYLRGGDINATNTINILDYSILKVRWYTADASADIDGSGTVGSTDYDIMKGNWFQRGDPE